MAKIVPSDQAPSEVVHYLLGGVDVELGGSGKGSKKSYETNDRTVIASANAHPWLEVEPDAAEQVDFSDYSTQIKPEDDAFSAAWPAAADAFDTDKIKAAEEERTSAPAVAINANLDQDEPVFAGPVAETVAAANEQKDND